MKRLSQWLAIALLTAAAGNALAAGATVDVFKAKDQSLLAVFDDHQIITCADQTLGEVDSAMDMQWNSSLFKADGSITMQSAIFVDLHYVNTCTGENLLMSGFAQNTNGSVSTDLASGHVDAVVPVMTDPDPDTGVVFTGSVHVNLNFTANGSTTTIRDRFHSQGGGVVFMNNFLVASRPGVATGTALSTLQGAFGVYNVELIGGQPSLSAQLGKDANGSMTIVTKAH